MYFKIVPPEDFTDEDAAWLLQDFPRERNVREIMADYAKGKVSIWRLVNGPQGIVVTKIHEGRLHIEQLIGEGISGILSELVAELKPVAKSVGLKGLSAGVWSLALARGLEKAGCKVTQVWLEVDV